MKLHLGCGKRNFGEDWVHVDLEEHPHVTWHDVTHLPYEDNSCDVLYSSHLLEYFDREEAATVLKEWYRVLKKGGTLRVAVPDFEAICNLYKTGYSLDKFLGPLYGKMGEIPYIFHKTIYDLRSLTHTLKKAGFYDVRRYNWRSTEHADHDDHSQAYLPHMDKEHGTLVSLNLEANK